MSGIVLPHRQGTILSPHRIMMDHDHIHRFSHTAIKEGGSGSIEFFDKDGRYIAGMTMKSKQDGIYVTANQILIPKQVCRHLYAPEDEEEEFQIHHLSSLPINDLSTLVNTEEFIIHQTNTDTAPQKLSQQLYNMELWHQHMGHVGWRTLQKTRDVVDPFCLVLSSAWTPPLLVPCS